MTTGTPDKAAILAKLPVRPDEDPYSVTIGGFYRRWFNLVDDMQLLIDTVKDVKSTEDEDWVPVWSAVGARYEKEAEAALPRNHNTAPLATFLQAKTYYSLARFPSPYHSGSSICPPDMSPIKAKSYEKYLECYGRATELLETKPEVVKVERAPVGMVVLRGRILSTPPPMVSMPSDSGKTSSKSTSESSFVSRSAWSARSTRSAPSTATSP